MLLFALLFSLAFSAEYEQCNEHYADRDAAAACCTGMGLELCSRNQVYSVVFGADSEYSQPEMCFSAYMTDDIGWWNSEPAYCSGYGWKSFVDPSGPGAHCCSADLPATEPITCQDAGPSICAEGRILGDSLLGDYCEDGVCLDEFCCVDFTPAELYQVSGNSYSYSSPEEAGNACKDLHPDYNLCTRTQLESLYENGDGGDVCSSSWLWDDTTDMYDRMWYNTQEEADAGFCGGTAGWRTWKPSTGEGGAHCCVSSYVNSGYNGLGSLEGKTMEEKQELGRAYCQGLADTTYPYQLCTKSKLLTVAYGGEASNICMSGVLESPNSDNVGDATCGWEQVEADVCGNGSTGWFGWCAESADLSAGAHCCLDYVRDYTPDYVKPDHGYDMTPDSYVSSGITSGLEAETECAARGFEGVCTVEQVKHVAENQGSYDSMGCLVGYMLDGTDYISGYWGTACDKEDRLYDAWQPAPYNPVAHCCDSSVPSSEIGPAVLDPLMKVGLYVYSSFADVPADTCDTVNGYSICTPDQVELVATVGVTRSDDSVQQDGNLCYQGYMADGSKGWYQTNEGQCGPTGWREFSGMAGLYCCLNFETNLGSVAPTAAPAIPVYKFLGTSYPYGTEEEAALACEAENPAYVLCNDDEVFTIATQGQEVVDNDAYEGVEQNLACVSGWVESAGSGEYVRGWFQSNPDCGAKYNQWNSWSMPDDSTDSGYRAGAHCCVASMIDSVDHPVVIVITTTEAPQTPPPTEVEVDTTAPSPVPTDWTPYSDLPSTLELPEYCVDMPDLVPQDFDGVLYYCATQYMIYLNGQTTCVDPQDPNADTLIADAFQNDWFLASGECAGQKSYEEATDDQLYITDYMLDNLEDDIDTLEADVVVGSSDVEAYIDDWQSTVSAMISAGMNNFDQATQQALQEYIDTHLSD